VYLTQYAWKKKDELWHNQNWQRGQHFQEKIAAFPEKTIHSDQGW